MAKLLHKGTSFGDRVVWALVSCSDSEIQAVMAQPERPVQKDGNEECLFTFAKAFHLKHEDWWDTTTGEIMERAGLTEAWLFSGYTHDDVTRVLERMGL